MLMLACHCVALVSRGQPEHFGIVEKARIVSFIFLQRN